MVMAGGSGPVSVGLVLASAGLWGVLGVGALGASAARAEGQGVRSERQRVQITVDTPEEGALVGDLNGMAFIAGRALARNGILQNFDVMFAIDGSESTSNPSQADVNGDGVVEDGSCVGAPRGLGIFRAMMGACPLSPDSILAVELLAVRTLLQRLDPRKSQVGIVAFGGDGNPKTADAFERAPLTANYPELLRVLKQIEEMGPSGQTNMQSGLLMAALELIGSQPAFTSDPRKNAQMIVLFLSDGLPTLPVLRSIQRNRRLAIDAAARAGKSKIRVDTYGIGQEALSQPETLVDMARVTQGVFTPILQARDLQQIFEQVDFSDIDVLRIVNRTTLQEARFVARSADGGFSALLEMVPGDNSIEIYARASDGSEGTRQLQLRFA
jgi:hypothetical protein